MYTITPNTFPEDSLGALRGFERNATRFPSAPCIVMRDGMLTYGQLRVRALRLAASIQRLTEGQRGFVGVYALREPVLYESVLGIMYAGSAYVPLSLKNPAERVQAIVSSSGMQICIVPQQRLAKALAVLPPYVTCIVPDGDDSDYPADRSGRIQMLSARENVTFPRDPGNGEGDPAYLMFTSGTTGKPKGIVIRHTNLMHFLSSIANIQTCGPGDRCSQAFDASFDLSVHDMFVTWEAGAALYPVPDGDLIAPAKFIQRNALTTWYSVPSVGLMMRRAGLLKEDSFPTLRYCMFCGDALPDDLARDWLRAAPNARLINYYGPTETTISISMHELLRGSHAGVRPYVSIGRVYPGHKYLLMGDGDEQSESSRQGELCIAGPQVFRGYLDDAERTASSFHVDEAGERYYRTGDLVEESDDGSLHFLGRIDHQVKIRGFRVELQEIEHVARGAVQTNFAVALAYRSKLGMDDDIGLFHNSPEADATERILAVAREQLPEYMIPRRVLHIDALPLTQNGKTDRSALRAILES